MAAEGEKATSSGGITMPWPGLQTLRQPAAIWRGMVRAESFLAGFDEPRRSFSTLDLVGRIGQILQRIADRGGLDRAGLTHEAAERLEYQLVDARWVLVANAAGREVPAAEMSFTSNTVVVCDACWRLAPLGTQRGFRGRGKGPRALCAEHSPAAGAAQAAALRLARRRMKRIEKIDHPFICRLDLPAPALLAPFTALFIAEATEGDSAAWSSFIDFHFPAVARTHPQVRCSVRAAFASLDGKDHREERLQLHEELACGTTPIAAVRGSERHDDVHPRIGAVATRHSRGALLLYTMLRTREFWLHVDKKISHGGARRGAGRRRRRKC